MKWLQKYKKIYKFSCDKETDTNAVVNECYHVQRESSLTPFHTAFDSSKGDFKPESQQLAIVYYG